MNSTADPTIFQSRLTSAKIRETLAKWVLRLGTYLVLAAATYIFLDITIKGGREMIVPEFPFINIKFLTESPETLHILKFNDGTVQELGDRAYRAFTKDHPEATIANHTTYVYAAGGIFPCIVGTVLLVVGSMTIAMVLGILSAIYLSEYSNRGRVIELLRLAIMNLAGVPSIVFGMFGYAMFVIFFNWNVSLMAGWFTLAFMVLPVIITASEESLRAVPQGFREGSLALGATKWQTIRQNVLPYALPGILTSSVLGIARVAGETAPIMFTAAFVVRDKLPWEVQKATDFFFNGVMALPYHIFVVSARVPQNEYTAKVQYAAAFVFLFLVMIIALASVVLRIKVRGKYKW
ncbi:MAG: phosphate ABC transporter permease PstA [Candidatus Methylacidiphilales bacterium]|nr:phosphate ABC transporter permease PstA [Candidatus Methylacidiphilales bacterium]